jgi:DNA invertase Pin-like site-specific DNA recombinase
MKTKQQFVSYFRVSTDKQGVSGLGLEAQRKAVETHLSTTKCTTSLAEFTEVESGKKSNRVELTKALDLCSRTGATLVIAKLDRLSRNLKFIVDLMESKVEFICCDMPSANKLTIQIMAVMAEHEAEMISVRTKAALAAAKERGVLLGSARPGHWEGRQRGPKLGSKRHLNNDKLVTQIRQLREAGDTYGVIAAKINDQGWTTSTDKQWTKSGVHRVLNHSSVQKDPICA